jgi:predicted phosphoribosyltransferase
MRGSRVFQNRTEAGQQLAEALQRYETDNTIVYALPRGGVVIGAEVARHLGVPLELVIARKIGHPFWREYAVGAVTETGEPVWNESERDNIDRAQQELAVQKERTEAKRRRIKYIGDRLGLHPEGKVVIIVDDGIATGLTMLAAVKDLHRKHPKKIVVAVPVAPADAVTDIEEYVDEVVTLETMPSDEFGAVGAYYRDFEQIEDYEVQNIMTEFATP